MKRIFAAITALAFSSACATRQAYNCQEYCATQGMVCAGQTSMSGSAVSTAYGYQPITTSTSGTAYSCRVTSTDSDKAELARSVASAQETYEKDQDAKHHNLWVALGVIAGIVALAFVIPTNPNNASN